MGRVSCETNGAMTERRTPATSPGWPRTWVDSHGRGLRELARCLRAVRPSVRMGCLQATVVDPCEDGVRAGLVVERLGVRACSLGRMSGRRGESPQAGSELDTPRAKPRPSAQTIATRRRGRGAAQGPCRPPRSTVDRTARRTHRHDKSSVCRLPSEHGVAIAAARLRVAVSAGRPWGAAVERTRCGSDSARRRAAWSPGDEGPASVSGRELRIGDLGRRDRLARPERARPACALPSAMGRRGERRAARLLLPQRHERCEPQVSIGLKSRLGFTTAASTGASGAPPTACAVV